MQGTNEATAHRISEAVIRGEFEALAELFSPDLVLNSPITDSFHFHGRDDVLALLEIVRASEEKLEFTDIVGGGDTWVLAFETTVRGRDMQGMDLMRFDDAGRVKEMTVFFRPLPGVAALAGALAPRLGRRRGRLVSLLLALLVRPLAAITSRGDQLAARLLGSTWDSTRRG